MANEAGKLDACASYLLFRHWIEEDRTVLRNANYCQQTKLCQNCAYFASIKTARSYCERAQQIINEHPTWLPMMMTFTLKNGKQLGATLKRLREGLKQVCQRRRDSTRYKPNEWGKIKAAAIRIEIKRGKNSGLWHPHAHALIFRERNEYFDLSAMQKEWSKYVKNGNFNLAMTSTAERILAGNKNAENSNFSLMKDCLEIFKYITKFSEATAEDLIEIHLKTHRQRLLTSWGGFHGLKEEQAAGNDFDYGGAFYDLMWSRNPDGSYRLVDHGHLGEAA